MVGPGFSLCPLRNHQATVTPLQRVPKLPKILLEIQEWWSGQGLCGKLLAWGSPSPSSSDPPVPCERYKSGLQEQKEVTSHVLHSSGAPQPQDMVQMPCENPALTHQPGKKEMEQLKHLFGTT